jgi:hypothetical protein
MPMNPEIKKRWVAALRSGEYRQGEGVLRTPTDKHCCLGVLCDLVDPTAWVTPDNSDNSADYVWVKNNYRAYTSIGLEALNSIGLTPEKQDNLIDLNDREGRSFAEIAQYIEEQL